VTTPEVDPAWWEHPELRSALKCHDVQAIFIQLQRHGWSQTAIGAAVGLSQGEVSQIKGGQRQVSSYAVLARIAEAFSINLGYMGLAWAAPAKSADQLRDSPAQRREVLGVAAGLAVGAGSPDLERWLPVPVESRATPPVRISAHDVSRLRLLTQGLWELDQHHGGGAALDTAAGTLAMANSFLRSQADPQTTVELHTAIADLHSLVGWSLHDLGHHSTATRHFLAALSFGSESGDLGMVSAALYRLGRVSLHVEEPKDALAAFQLGQMAAQNAGSYADLARFHVSAAWAYALMGQPDRMEDSFSRAEDELGRIDSANEAPWVTAFIRSGDWDGVRAMSYIILARRSDSSAARYAEKAAEVAGMIVSTPKLGRPGRSRVFDEIIYAAGRLRTGDRAEGLVLAHAAVDKVEELRSIRAVDRLRDVERAALLVRDGSTRDLVERIARLREHT
jgi:transcriptional regulator with XRE-family HTH domain/plasmid stabilization system protein ParE